MTSKNEILKLLKILASTYPGYNLTEDTPDVYFAVLNDIPYDVLKTAALDHISRSPWFPKVSELRKAAVDIALDSRRFPNAYDAWGEMEYAMRRWGRDRKPDFDNAVLERTIAALGWRNLCMSTNQVADRARFIEAYNIYRQRSIDEAVTLPQVKELSAKLAGSLSSPDFRGLPVSSEPEDEGEL
jgi:hypothetical protein